jgi:hypothetical protein
MAEIVNFNTRPAPFIVSNFNGTKEGLCAYDVPPSWRSELALLLGVGPRHPLAAHALAALGARLERLPEELRLDVPAAAKLAAERGVQLVRCFWPGQPVDAAQLGCQVPEERSNKDG